jgi:hypothetical protein
MQERYNNMILLHMEIQILVYCNIYQGYATFAESLLRLYVTNSAKIYIALNLQPLKLTA